MKQIVTALGNHYLNDKLCEEKSFDVLAKDIQYQDGIFEILEKEEKIDFLILSEILLGENKIEKLIDKIKEKNNFIKIIIILENEKEELENILYAKGVIKIYYNNKVEIKEIISFIKNEKNNENEKIKIELENLKELLIKNNISFEKETKKNNLLENKIKQKNKMELIKKENKKVISIVGTGGVGKSIITVNLSNILKEKKIKF